MSDEDIGIVESEGMSTGKKVAIGLGVCCIGIIILAFIGGMMSPDKTSTNTTNNVTSNDASQDNKNSDDENHINVTTNDTFMFYSNDSPACKDGYEAAIVVNDTPYYIDSAFFKLEGYSPSFNEGLKKREDSSVDFELSVDKPFSFTFTHERVGANKDALVVKKLYKDDGSEL